MNNDSIEKQLIRHGIRIIKRYLVHNSNCYAQEDGCENNTVYEVDFLKVKDDKNTYYVYIDNGGTITASPLDYDVINVKYVRTDSGKVQSRQRNGDYKSTLRYGGIGVVSECDNQLVIMRTISTTSETHELVLESKDGSKIYYEDGICRPYALISMSQINEISEQVPTIVSNVNYVLRQPHIDTCVRSDDRISSLVSSLVTQSNGLFEERKSYLKSAERMTDEDTDYVLHLCSLNKQLETKIVELITIFRDVRACCKKVSIM